MTPSSPERFRQLAVLFQEALLLPPGPEREAWLRSKSGADAAMREEVASLLESDAAVRRRVSSASSHLLRTAIPQARIPAGTGQGNPEPPRAASAGRFNQVRKLGSHGKPASAAMALLALSIVGGLVASLWESRLAERRFADACELVQHFQFDLRQSVARASGSALVEAEMAGRSLDYLDRLAGLQIHEPALRTEIGEGYAELGAALASSSQAGSSDKGQAMASFRKAIAVLDPLAAGNPGNLRVRLCLARSRLELGRIDGNAAEGLIVVRQAARELDEIARRWPTDFEVRSQAAAALRWLAAAVAVNGGYANPQNLSEALDALSKAIGNASAAARLRPQLPEAWTALAANYERMGGVVELRDRPAAIEFYRHALEALNRIPSKDPDAPPVQAVRSAALLGLGWNLGNVRAFTPALAALEEARQIRGSSENTVESTMALYFRTVRDLRRAGMPASQSTLSARGAGRAGNSTPITPLIPRAGASPNPQSRLSSFRGREWENVLIWP
jgi:tetratricopeptide (TPR) repeat protein